MHVVVVDLVDGSVCALGTWATANAEDVYVDEDRTLLVKDRDSTYVVRDGVTTKGPRQSIHGVLFAHGTETRVIAWIDTRGPSQLFESSGQSILDLTTPDQPRQIAALGGRLMGQLDDGRILVASSNGVGTNATLVLQALSLDGNMTILATVPHTRYSIAFHRQPRPEVTVAVFGSERGLDDVITIELASGTQTKTGTVPIVATEGTGRPSPDDAFVARNTFELPVGVRITTPAGDEVLLMHVATGTGALNFRGWVRR